MASGARVYRKGSSRKLMLIFMWTCSCSEDSLFPEIGVRMGREFIFSYYCKRDCVFGFHIFLIDMSLVLAFSWEGELRLYEEKKNFDMMIIRRSGWEKVVSKWGCIRGILEKSSVVVSFGVALVWMFGMGERWMRRKGGGVYLWRFEVVGASEWVWWVLSGCNSPGVCRTHRYDDGGLLKMFLIISDSSSHSTT